ncbi:50S ribosomal protein L5 [Patescibacteria group bacterium]
MDLKAKYKKEVVANIKKKFGFKNDLRVPRIKKVVINTGIGKLREEKEREEIKKMLELIAGQKPQPCLAKKAIASFKTRQGLIIGFRVTLRGKRMYDFLERLVWIAIPRMRDFRGIDLKSIDEGGNLNIGIREHIIFPEMSGEDVRKMFGLQITIVTNAETREEAVELFRELGFPLKRQA